MTKEKLTAFLTTKLTFELLLYEILLSTLFCNKPKIKAITFLAIMLLTFCSYLTKCLIEKINVSENYYTFQNDYIIV